MLMSVIILLVIFSLLLAIGFLLAFLWSVKDGQFEDDYTPSVRMLFENPVSQTKNSYKLTNSSEDL
jgi:cbb3-type cytochrome oxidase maturation protein